MKKMQLAAALMGICLAASVSAQAKTLEFQIGNNTLYTSDISIHSEIIDASPYIENSRTMVPIRVITENFDANVAWDAETKTVTITNGDNVIKLTIGSYEAYVNDKLIMLDTVPVLSSDRTMVPVRFITENLGYTVTYVPETKQIIVSNNPPIMTIGEKIITIDDFKTAFAVTSNMIRWGSLEEFTNTMLFDFKINALASCDAKLKGIDTQDLGLSSLIATIEKNKDVFSRQFLTSVYLENIKNQEIANLYKNMLEVEEITDKEVQEFYEKNHVSAKHILLRNVNKETNAPLDAVELEKVKERASDLLDKIKKGEDFDKLMLENTEDTGIKSNPEGYTFSKGVMVKEFEDTAFSLDVNAVSDVVETEYGFHIIKRVPLMEITNETKENIYNYLHSVKLDNKVEELEKEIPVTMHFSTAEINEMMTEFVINLLGQ
ncbi:MAG: stalk domain-containing protein [Clostridia bacterium]|nr:stalk domain-containing protein [Clostridia bacterium]